MINKIISQISNIDKSILKVIKKVLKISFIMCLISILILCIYITNPVSSSTYFLGLKLFKTSLTYIVAGIICGFFFDFIINKRLI